jgi:ADP-ribose pyrophosphatase YjhB (NUDIX family)
MVGVHPLVLKDGRLLLAKRAKEPSKGKWSLPGGKVELGETVCEAAKRELLEECSIEIEIERLLDVADMIIKDDDGRISYHFVLIYVVAKLKSGDVRIDSENVDFGWFAPAEIAGLDMNPLLRDVLVRAGLSTP